MFKAALKSVFAHKLRLALTGLAIVLGVGFVAGTFVFTNTINKVFDDLFVDAFAGIDVIVQADVEYASDFSVVPVDAAVLDEVQAVDGVAVAEGGVTGFAQIIDKAGDPIVPLGPPTLGGSWNDDPALLGNISLREGTRPEGTGEVTVDAATADKHDLLVGDRIDILLPIGRETFDLVGIVSFGESDNLAGATFAAWDLPEAQRVLDLEGQYVAISVLAEEGLAAPLLRDRIDAALGDSLEVVTAADEAAEQAASLQDALGFISTVLLVFAAISVFVGSFIIYNTFSIVVAQRVRELGLLRAVGATGNQVVRMVVTEALIMALIASVVGVGFGVLVSMGLYALMDAAGFSVPSTSPQVGSTAVIVALIVGLVVTVISALVPAVRASRVPPIAAMSDIPFTRRPMWQRGVAGGAVILGGVAVIAYGLLADVELGPINSLVAVGLGALLVFIGVAMASVVIIRPLATVLGWPFRTLSKLTGRLATDNAVRRPRRAASTASALMIGLALVGFFYILGASIKATAGTAIEERLRADFVVSTSGFIPTIVPEFADGLATEDEITAATSFRINFFDREGTEEVMAGVDADTVADTVDLQVVEGSVEALAAGGIFVFDDTAADLELAVGDTMQVGFAATGLQELEVVGLFSDTAVVQVPYLVGMDTFEANYTDRLESVVAVKLADGVSTEQGRAIVEAAAADFPNAEVRNQAEYRKSQEDQVNVLLGLFQGLLFLAVIIALLGIMNTLFLSIYERTHEIGLLRAVGMSRWQVRRMVLWESIVVAIIGGILGIVVGVFFGVAVVAALDDEGIDVLSIPAGQLAALVIVAAVAGILAAVLPARRAAKLNVLEAIAYE